MSVLIRMGGHLTHGWGVSVSDEATVERIAGEVRALAASFPIPGTSIKAERPMVIVALCSAIRRSSVVDCS